MTENEAIEIHKRAMKVYETEFGKNQIIIDLYKTSIKALDEIQQYRALGMVEEVKCAMKYLSLAKKHGTIGQVIDSCAEYESLGTVEELQEATEKQRAKKGISRKSFVAIHNECPTCGYNLFGNIPSTYCPNCGQKIDWSEEE